MNRPLINWPDIKWPDAHIKDTLTFLRAITSDPSQVGAIAPSGPALARLITSEIGSHSGPIIELGPGTGVFTQALLDQGVRERDLTLVETCPQFAKLLRERFPAASVLQMDARHLHRRNLFPQNSIGAVVSGLPLLNLSPPRVLALLRGAFRCMQPGGAFYQFTYGPLCPVPKPCLDRLNLKSTCLGRVLNNFPPASVFRITQSA
jgi:phospholipid N-methyltransferase